MLCLVVCWLGRWWLHVEVVVLVVGLCSWFVVVCVVVVFGVVRGGAAVAPVWLLCLGLGWFVLASWGRGKGNLAGGGWGSGAKERVAGMGRTR